MEKRNPPRYTISTRLFVIFTVMLLAAFALIAWINTNLYLNLLEKQVYEHAIQVSDLIKSSTWYSMLMNHRDDLSNIIANIGKEKGLQGVWIYDKLGVVRFASDTSEINTRLEKHSEQCSFCHAGEPAIGTIPKQNRIRQLKGSKGERIVGLINPIENSNACSSAECHAHGPEEKLLGLIDIKMSMASVDVNIRKTRATVLLLSGFLVLLTAILFRRIIQRMIHRPVSKLVYGTEQVASMNLDYQIPVESNDDLGYLSESFNKMTQKLKRASEAEKEWSETLEMKVREKTEELERTHEHIILVEKMASLGKLAAVVAHEINNPIAGILTYAKLTIRNLSQGDDNGKTKDSIDNLKMIGDEAKRCGDIVKNLLLFSKRRYEEMSEHDIIPVLNRSLELAKHSSKKTEIAFEKEVIADNTTIVCDPNSIQQMLLIFFMNAIDAVPNEGGQIAVKVYNVDNGRSLCLEISDNGIGISKDDMSHIFEPFFTTKDSSENTGLGLAVAYRIIVARHEGRISVNSTVGEGTTFVIELPVAGPANHKAKAENQQRDPTREVS
jgi:two-component system NtrC family sensor kinase